MVGPMDAGTPSVQGLFSLGRPPAPWTTIAPRKVTGRPCRRGSGQMPRSAPARRGKARARRAAPRPALPRLPELEQRQLDLIGLGLVAAGIFLGFLVYLHRDGEIGRASCRERV